MTPLTQTNYSLYSDHIDNFANKYIAEYSHPRTNHFGGELLKEQI